MGGALLQLAAIGAQDVYLTGNPQITFFKMVYKRNTNYAMEEHKIEFDGQVDFGKKVVCNITRNGDLLSNIFLYVELPALTKKILLPGDQGYNEGINFTKGINNTTTTEKLNPEYVNQHSIISWVNSIGHVLLEYVTIEIGGQQIDKQYGEWLEIWDELTLSKCKQIAYENRMIGKYSRDEWYTKGIYENALDLNLYIPLNFWFCRNIGLALPLVALQYHEVKIYVKFNDFEKCWFNAHINKKKGKPAIYYPSKKNIKRAYLLCNYIYLDTDERKKFAQTPHEYLIDQLQFNDPVTVSCNMRDTSINLEFNHPIKEIVWVGQKNNVKYTNDWFNYSAEERINVCNDDNISSLINENNLIDKKIYTYKYADINEYQTNEYLFMNSFNTVTYSSMNTVLENIKKNILTTSSSQEDSLEQYDIRCPTIGSSVLQLNGIDRFSEQHHKFFDTLQPYLRHSCIPRYGNIQVYSFCLEPEKMVPTGSCNFSRVDNATLHLKINKICFCDETTSEFVDIRIYALNYNILRIMSGMGGVAYTN